MRWGFQSGQVPEEAAHLNQLGLQAQLGVFSSSVPGQLEPWMFGLKDLECGRLLSKMVMFTMKRSEQVAASSTLWITSDV